MLGIIDNTNLNINYKRVPRWCAGTRTLVGRMVGADGSTELWRHPKYINLLRYLVSSVLRRPHHFSGQSNFFITAFDSWIKVCFNVLMLPLCHCNYFNFFSFVRSTTVWLQLSASFFNEIVKTVKMCIEKFCFGSVQCDQIGAIYWTLGNFGNNWFALISHILR